MIKKQTGYKFLYTIEQLQKAMPITIELKDVELLEALRIIFSNQPLTYAIIEKNIVIKPKAKY
ncbi:MAG: STN domain-containing protein [Bacteroidota bacterium]